MNQKPKIPQADVVAWLNANHPELVPTIEFDRAWVWIAADLRDKPEVRKSLKAYGFAFAKSGGHKLPSGAMGTWGHSCQAPTPFKRKGFSGKSQGDARKSQPAASSPGGNPAPSAAPQCARVDPLAQPPAQPQPETTFEDSEVLAFALGQL